MPRANWVQYLREPLPGLLNPTASSVAECVESPAQTAPVEGPVPEVAGTTITFHDSVYRTWSQWVSEYGRGFPDAQDVMLPQQRGPNRATIEKWYAEGRHSRIPTCCIEWFCTRWALATATSLKRYKRLLKKLHEEHTYLWQPGFIPCPTTIRAKDIVFMHHCDDHCRAKNNAVVHEVPWPTIRRYSDAPRTIPCDPSQREDNAGLYGVIWSPRP